MLLLNDKKVEYGNFPNKELYIIKNKLLMSTKINTINFIYDDQLDIIKLILLQNHIKDCLEKSILHIQYLPYSRMDRLNNDYNFSLKAIASLINSMDFVKVIIREPHSNVSLNLIDRSIEEEWCMGKINFIETFIKLKDKSIFYPDKGAAERYSKHSLPTAFGKKVRDFTTGKITSFEIEGTVKQNILIVDDICSRGGTFKEAAIKLKAAGAKRVSLLVSYCEENVLTGDLFEHIDNLYTSIDCNVIHPQIHKL